MIYRQGTIDDVEQLRRLALKSWGPFQKDLTPENWHKLVNNLYSEETFLALLEKSYGLVCENPDKEVIGMAFLVPSGNPTEIFPPEWCYIRFVSVNPEFGGRGIGRQLTEKCIEVAKGKKEQTVALHTSEIMSKARRLYERLGFTVVREIEPRLGKRYWLYKLEIA